MAVLWPPTVTNCCGDTVGVAWGLQRDVEARPGDVPFLVPAEPVLPALLPPPGRLLPLPAAEPPPPLPPVGPDGWPVSIVELTWTIACRNGGTASAMLAMKATPVSTKAGRSHPMPELLSDFRAGARCRGGAAFAAPGATSRSRSRGRPSGQAQAQWPRQTQFRAWPTAPAATLTSHGFGW